MKDKFMRNKSQGGERGAVLVEFAILVPFLLLLLVGVAEIGYLYFHLNILNKSVQDAALYFSDSSRARKDGVYEEVIDVSTAGNGSNLTATQNLVIYGTTCTSPTVTCSNSYPCTSSSTVACPLLPNPANNYQTPIYPTSPATNHIRVTAVYNHQFMLGNLLNSMCRLVGGGNCFPNNQYTLRASTVFRVEGGST